MGDREAVQALGWVREMWGYCIGAASLGIKHRVLDGFQFEGGSIGNRERRLEWPTPAAPVGPERGYYLFHYTYGVEYSREGLPMELQVTGARHLHLLRLHHLHLLRIHLLHLLRFRL